MRAGIFAERCAKELLRDPLSWLFCLAFPMGMLGIMTLLNTSLPPEASLVIFRIDYLAAGVAVFGFSFLMLFTALLAARDRSTAFLVRLFISPMRAGDFLLGYAVPPLCIALGQLILTYLAALGIGVLTDVSLSVGKLCLSALMHLPTVVLFVSLGLLFGTLFSDKSAPGFSSFIISAAGMLGGIWMDVDSIGGVLADICRVLPFYHAVRLGRAAIVGTDLWDTLISLAVVCGYAALTSCLTVVIFRQRMRMK